MFHEHWLLILLVSLLFGFCLPRSLPGATAAESRIKSEENLHSTNRTGKTRNLLFGKLTTFSLRPAAELAAPHPRLPWPQPSGSFRQSFPQPCLPQRQLITLRFSWWPIGCYLDYSVSPTLTNSSVWHCFVISGCVPFKLQLSHSLPGLCWPSVRGPGTRLQGYHKKGHGSHWEDRTVLSKKVESVRPVSYFHIRVPSSEYQQPFPIAVKLCCGSTCLHGCLWGLSEMMSLPGFMGNLALSKCGLLDLVRSLSNS